MKLLFIDTLKAYQLTREEQYNVKAEGPSLKGGPDTDGEEDCFVLPPSAEKDKCYDRKNNFKV